MNRLPNIRTGLSGAETAELKDRGYRPRDPRLLRADPESDSATRPDPGMMNPRR